MDILENKSNKNSIKRFTREEKLMIVEQLKTKNARDIAHIYNVHERTVRKWKTRFDIELKNKRANYVPRFKQSFNVQGTVKTDTSKMNIVQSDEMGTLKINTDEIDIIKIESVGSALDKELYEWCLDRKSKGLPISKSMLKETALIFNEELGGDSNFIASEYWFSSWQQRMNIECVD